jgi:cysteine desulfurase
VFTSGGTESINLALKGVAEMYREKGTHLVTTAIEQRATMDVCKRLERQGFEITYVPVGRDGLVDVEAIRAALTPKTILISVMFANNEIGTIQQVAEIGKLAKEKGIVFHTDATQAAGKVPIDVEAMGIDVLSCTAHLMYGPKGVGALYVRRKGPRVRVSPMIDGGGHERGMRSGTVPVPLVVGSGGPPRSARRAWRGEPATRGAPRSPPGLHPLQGGRGVPQRAPGTPTRPQPEPVVRLRRRRVGPDGAEQGSGASSGSATSATLEPSYVSPPSGSTLELAHSSIRFGLHRFSTEEEVDYVGIAPWTSSTGCGRCRRSTSSRRKAWT